MDIHQFEPLWGSWYLREVIGAGSYGVKLGNLRKPGKMPGTWQALREYGQNGTFGGTWFSSSEQLNSGV